MLWILIGLGETSCAACRQKVAKSGGIGTPVKICTPAALYLRDLRRVVGGAVFVSARIEHREAGLFEQRDHVRAQRVAVGIVGEHDADLLVGRDLSVAPLRNIGLGEFGDAEREVIGPLERRGLRPAWRRGRNTRLPTAGRWRRTARPRLRRHRRPD